MIFRGGEFSTGEMGNFHPALTVGQVLPDGRAGTETAKTVQETNSDSAKFWR